MCNSVQNISEHQQAEQTTKPTEKESKRQVKKRKTRSSSIGNNKVECQNSTLVNSEGSSRKRTKKINCNVQVHEALPPSLSFPFDGNMYTQTDDEFCSTIDRPRDSSIVILDNTSSDRFYSISSAGASVVYPSVTTVLSNTITTPQYYRLRNWKRSMIKEYGKEEFENIQKQTVDTGTYFHKVHVSVCS